MLIGVVGEGEKRGGGAGGGGYSDIAIDAVPYRVRSRAALHLTVLTQEEEGTAILPLMLYLPECGAGHH